MRAVVSARIFGWEKCEKLNINSLYPVMDKTKLWSTCWTPRLLIVGGAHKYENEDIIKSLWDGNVTFGYTESTYA